MSLLHEPAPDDRQLERYLLGLLPEEDTDRLDQASIEDDDVAARIRIAEDDLIDAYVRRTLEPDTRQRFEAYYLSSPGRRQRVIFAARFLRAIDRAAARADSESGTHDDPPSSPETQPGAVPAVRRSKLPVTLATAAALLLAATVLVLLSAGPFGGIAPVDRETAAVERPAREAARPPDARAAADAAKIDTREPQPATTARDGARISPAAPSAGPAPAKEATTIALVLPPQTRASGPVPALTLPAGADHVAIELRLEPHQASRYEVGLNDPALNRVVWRSGWIAERVSGEDASLVVVVPVRLLKAQHYVFDLNVSGAGGRPEVVGSYTFQVLPR